MYVTCHFPLVAFDIFVFIFNFHHFDYYVSVCSSLGLSCVELSALLGHGWLFPSSFLGKFSAILLQIFSQVLSVFSFWDPYNVNVGASSVVPEVPKELMLSKLWCWRRLLRVPWITRRSNQSILKEINPDYSLEGLMLKFWYFGHLIQRASSLEKTLMLGKIKDRRRRGWQRMEVGWHCWFNGHDIEQTLGDMEDREAWYAVVQGLQSQTQLSETTRNQLQGKTGKFTMMWRLKNLTTTNALKKKF